MDVKRHVLGISTSEPIPPDVMMDVKSYVHRAMDWYQLPAIYQLLHDSLISAKTRSAESLLSSCRVGRLSTAVRTGCAFFPRSHLLRAADCCGILLHPSSRDGRPCFLTTFVAFQFFMSCVSSWTRYLR